MNTIYLVCTRSAITASALTYIINSSPDCYNLSHNNLWLTEESEWFGTAHIVNDWWNISDRFKNTGYDAEFRNTDALTEDQLVRLNNAWQDMNTGKDICLFTHARNVDEIQKFRDQHKLPIKIITTIMGEGCYQFIGGVFRREYNEEMNEYENILASWEHTYNQITVQDNFWKSQGDVCFKMRDWLVDTQFIYQTLNITPNHNIKLWCDQYLLFNDMSEEFETECGVIFSIEKAVYMVQLFVYFVQTYGGNLNEAELKAFANALPDTHQRRPRLFDFDDFANAAAELAGISVDKITKTV